MTRGVDARIADVRRLIAAGRRVFDGRARWAGAIARSTGLTPEGVELGFSCLEREATEAELRVLVAAAGDSLRVHVIVSANVFVAPLRALALARAASEQVTVRPSPRDPTLTRALVDAVGDDAIRLIEERDPAAVDATEIHAYGRDDTIAEVRARARPGVRVRGHGAGLGVALVTRAAEVSSAAGALAADVVPFDQRGCLSPRVALVEGDLTRAAAFAAALHDHLCEWAGRVPRGELSASEREEAARWRDALAFAGHVRVAPDHVVGLAPARSALAVPPPGRHVQVAAVETMAEAAAAIGAVARFVVAVGSDDPARAAEAAPGHARVGPLGSMQRPRLDGPVDRRSFL